MHFMVFHFKSHKSRQNKSPTSLPPKIFQPLVMSKEKHATENSEIKSCPGQSCRGAASHGPMAARSFSPVQGGVTDIHGHQGLANFGPPTCLCVAELRTVPGMDAAWMKLRWQGGQRASCCQLTSWEAEGKEQEDLWFLPPQPRLPVLGLSSL